jgi:2-polyprenyl-6-methoxyphenol hydroxylase-like FAD-dependent oxidoreductase
MRCDVIVVGAGPVGLSAALRLNRAGISVTVVEALASPQEDLRASTFHPPTLEMLDEDGITAELLAQGMIAPDFQVRLHATGEYARFDLSVLADETPHPYRLQCEQSKLVRVLVERLRARGVPVLWSHSAETLVQDASGVRLRCTTPAGPVELRAAYLIGADGARSVVRKQLGLTFEGETFPETTILSTTVFPFEQHLPGLSAINYCWGENGAFSLLRLPDVWRVSLYADEGQSVEAAMEPDAIERKLQTICAQTHPYPVGEVRAYRIHQRVVDSYRVGRVLLAGDAAHINSPSGGMGMNGGIHDAFSLADALAQVLCGAPDDLLDRYQRQRHPIALEHVLAQSGRNRARMQQRDPGQRLRSLRDLQAIAADPVRAKAHMMTTSMIDGLRRSREIA